ncbi:MAG: hypothetical protein AABZ55_07410, partial [Bdellovibrionota bacterium]
MRSGWGFLRENWQYLLVIAPAFAAGFAVRYYIQMHEESPASHEATKISEYKHEGRGVASGSGPGFESEFGSKSKSISKSKSGNGSRESEFGEELPKNKKSRVKESDAAAAVAAGILSSLKAAEPKPVASPSFTPVSLPSDSPDSFAAIEIPEEKMVSEDGTCRSYEGHGDASEHIAIDQKDWDKVMDQYHEAKRDLLAWLDSRKMAFSTKTYEHMSDLVKNLKIQRPPNSEEPDLSWRGI